MLPLLLLLQLSQSTTEAGRDASPSKPYSEPNVCYNLHHHHSLNQKQQHFATPSLTGTPPFLVLPTTAVPPVLRVAAAVLAPVAGGGRVAATLRPGCATEGVLEAPPLAAADGLESVFPIALPVLTLPPAPMVLSSLSLALPRSPSLSPSRALFLSPAGRLRFGAAAGAVNPPPLSGLFPRFSRNLKKGQFN